MVLVYSSLHPTDIDEATVTFIGFWALLGFWIFYLNEIYWKISASRKYPVLTGIFMAETLILQTMSVYNAVLAVLSYVGNWKLANRAAQWYLHVLVNIDNVLDPSVGLEQGCWGLWPEMVKKIRVITSQHHPLCSHSSVTYRSSAHLHFW